MTKQNNSNYERWAKRRSTTYLLSFWSRAIPARTKARLLNEVQAAWVPPFERKISAAYKELLSRGALDEPYENPE